MFLLDSLLIGGLRFVLDQVSTIADRELNNEDTLRERLLEAQMRLELGEIDQQEFGRIECEVLERMREIRARTRGDVADSADGEHKVTGVEISVMDDES